MNKYMENTKVYTAFLFMDHAFWKENIEGRVKFILKSIILNCCIKVTMAICVKKLLTWGNDILENLAPKFPSKGGAMSHNSLPPYPQEIAPVTHIFCVTGYEWSLAC